MGRFVLRRLLLLVPTLFGISLLTFLLLNLTPGSLLAGIEPGATLSLQEAHRRAEQELGMRDARTGELKPLLTRYREWLVRAARFEFGRPGDDEAAFRTKIARALPPTLLVNGLALWIATLLGLAVGAHLGMRSGSSLDRAAGGMIAVLSALPEMLVATLLILFVGGGMGATLLPVTGLATPGAQAWPVWRRGLDLVAHLVLPVFVVTCPVFAILTRLVRDAVRHATDTGAFRAARGFGAMPAELRALALRAGTRPLATVVPMLAASCVAGSFVVEPLFAIDGMGMLAWRAFTERDQAMVMALTLILSVATLLALAISDLLQAWLDPRVRLA